MPTTSAGDATRIASVSRLRSRISNVRRVSTLHCVSALATGRPGAPWFATSGGEARWCAHVGDIAVEDGQASVELRDRAGIELLERIGEHSDEGHSSATRHEHDAVAGREVLWTECVVNTTSPIGRPGRAGGRVHPRSVTGIEAGGRLVEGKKAGRVGEQLDGDRGALALPAAQRPRPGRRSARSSPTASIASRTAAPTSSRSPTRGSRSRTRRVVERCAGAADRPVDDVVLRHVDRGGCGRRRGCR